MMKRSREKKNEMRERERENMDREEMRATKGERERGKGSPNTKQNSFSIRYLNNSKLPPSSSSSSPSSPPSPPPPRIVFRQWQQQQKKKKQQNDEKKKKKNFPCKHYWKHVGALHYNKKEKKESILRETKEKRGRIVFLWSSPVTWSDNDLCDVKGRTNQRIRSFVIRPLSHLHYISFSKTPFPLFSFFLSLSNSLTDSLSLSLSP